ncbi:MAG: hypothetical protein K8I29_15825 [Alphaproteobacteria bacterium]|uniref:Uncharacterized protein n=1 Tax=Candidatus Nitrobium versatile TaxID=2884831 RepID=A0A953M225_9BACT|nr:hypothetical protein [Candidatus Nitrobium versatile]
MKTGRATRKGLYIGAGAGLVLFALAGLLPGSFIGGVIGITIAGKFFGAPLAPAVLPRVIVGMFMVLGVFTSGVVFVTGGSLLGWCAGTVLDTVRERRAAAAAAMEKCKETSDR